MRTDGWEQLDTMRLILASVVAVNHTLGIFAWPFGALSQEAFRVWEFGAEYSVFGFFVISGMVIGRSLMRKAKDGDRLFVTFMQRRFLRIYPPLLFCTFLTALFAVTLRTLDLDEYVGPAVRLTRTEFAYLDHWKQIGIALATFGLRGDLEGATNGPLWSLHLELQAYVVCGLVAQIIVARTTLVRIAAVIGLLVAARMRGLHWPESTAIICFLCFGAGLVLSAINPRLPKMLPVIPIDFSYSLYILHFPVGLFVFFVTCQGEPPAPTTALLLSVLVLALSIAASVFSGLFVERHRWLRARPGLSL